MALSGAVQTARRRSQLGAARSRRRLLPELPLALDGLLRLVLQELHLATARGVGRGGRGEGMAAPEMAAARARNPRNTPSQLASGPGKKQSSSLPLES